MAEVKMEAVSSSNVSAIGYDADTQRLYVSFNIGSGGYYEGPDESVYQSFLASESKGRFVAHRLKGQFPWVRA
jgi:hypothetical protein